MAHKNISSADTTIDPNLWKNGVFDLNRPMTAEEMEHQHWLLEMNSET